MRNLSLVVTLLLALAAPTWAQPLNGTLLKIKETKKVSIGFQEASIPFSYLDQDRKVVGFAIDICAHIVDAIRKTVNEPDLQVSYVPVASSSRIPLLLNGTIDLNCSAGNNTLERQKQIAFTNSHFLTANRFLVKKTSNIKTLDDLKGKSVVSVAGSVNLNQLNKFNTERNMNMNVLSAKDQLEAFIMLDTDRAHAFMQDDNQLAVAVARSKDPSAYAFNTDSFSKAEPYGIMLRKNDPAFKSLLDTATSTLFKSAEMERLYKKWFQAPIPPNGVNLNFPMDAALRNAYKNPSDSADPDHYITK